MADVIVVGGGVIGLSIAYELAGQGVAVKVLEQGQLGREASWAGAGILPPGNPDHARTPEARLRAESYALWPALSTCLLDETGVDNGFRNCGGLEVQLSGSPSDLDAEIDSWQAEKIEIERLSTWDLLEYEPNLNSQVVAGYRLPELCQVRNPRHLKALIAGCSLRGVDLVPGSPVVRFDVQGDTVRAVHTPGNTHCAGQFLVAGGAWSQQLLAAAGLELDLEPVRGQIVMLSTQPLPFRHVIQRGSRYLVPRPDGRILIGSTEEWVGFDKKNTASAVAELIQFAVDLVPSLSEARYERSWAGLRPHVAGRPPYLGAVPNLENLFVATGHFRAGLQLSPITGVLMRQLILGQTPVIPLEPFAFERRGEQRIASR